VWFDPSLAVTYWPREKWTSLVRQFRSTGTWRGELVRRYGRRNSVRFFAPPALVALTAVALVVAALQLTGVLTGSAPPRHPLSTSLAAYIALVAVRGERARGAGLAGAAVALVVIPSMHLAWGAGFLVGVARGARENIDTSRLRRNTPCRSGGRPVTRGRCSPGRGCVRRPVRTRVRRRAR
jgi:hypothetical protein